MAKKPWGAIVSSDYDIEQWHKACLIHNHEGTPTSKEECLLLIRTPEGVLDRNGLNEAASVLVGDDSGLTRKQKATAANLIIDLYAELEETPPPGILDSSEQDTLSQSEQPANDSLAHLGIKGMKWGVKRDERALNTRDQALNLSQRSQVKIANTISTLAAVGLATNAAAAAFQLQSRWEHLTLVRSVIDQAENNPLISDATREGLRLTKQKIVSGLVASAAMTTAITFAIGAVTTRTAKAYFAPLHKSYSDVKPRVNADLKALSRDIKKGKRPSMSVKDYNAEVSKIVQKHLSADRNNFLSPFHELARSQLGTEYNTKDLKITFEKLPNSDLYDKMTVVTPNGLKLIKAIKRVEHADTEDLSIGDIDIFFDYEFDTDGHIVGWTSPTIEIAIDMFEGRFTIDDVEKEWVKPVDRPKDVDKSLSHFITKNAVNQPERENDPVLHKGLVLVALPADGDLTRAVGSEEKHVTLLYLGDDVSDEVAALVQSSIQEVMRTSSLRPFVETVSSVVNLGKNGARVWMIDSSAGLRPLRDRLAKQPAIRALYDTVEQFPNYTPHMTIGYPVEGQSSLSDFEETQARIVRRITFDRIALWHGENHDMIWRLPANSEVEDSEEVDEFLAHLGIKGMKWGVRKSESSAGQQSISKTINGAANAKEFRAAVRAKTKAGTATLGEAHMAAVKTTGERLTNAFLGDKIYWRQTLAIAGVAGLAVGASFAIPALLPAGALVAVAANVGPLYASLLAGSGATAAAVPATAAVGAQVFAGLGVVAAVTGAQVAGLVSGVGNAKRAITGNRRIDKNYAALGDHVTRRQYEGSKATKKLLSRSGVVSRSSLKHASELAHADNDLTVQDIMDGLSKEQRDLFNLVVGAVVSDVDIPDTDVYADIYNALSDIQQNVLHFIVGAVTDKAFSIEHAALFNENDEFLAHFGIKGMRWGFRRPRGEGGTVTSGLKDDDSDSSGSTAGGSTTGSGLNKERLSADAERFLTTRQKESHQLSDKEIKDANSRAQAIKSYNELFGPKPNQEMQNKVDALRLEKDYRTLQAELYPTAMSKVVRLIRGSEAPFKSFTGALQALEGNVGAFKSLNKVLKQALDTSNDSRTPRPVKNPTVPSGAQTPRQEVFVKNKVPPRSSGNSTVYDVSSMGRRDPAPGNPFLPVLEAPKRS